MSNAAEAAYYDAIKYGIADINMHPYSGNMSVLISPHYRNAHKTQAPWR